MIKFQQSQAITSHFESFWSIVQLNSNPCIVNASTLFLLTEFFPELCVSCNCPRNLAFSSCRSFDDRICNTRKWMKLHFSNFCQMSEIWQLHHHICWEEIRIVKWRNLWKVEKSKTAFEIFFENCMMRSVERSLYLFRSCKGHEITICSNLLNCLTC